MPCRRTGRCSSSSPVLALIPPPSCPDRPDANASEPLFPQKRDETARNGPEDRRSLRAADDHLEALQSPPPDRHHEAPAGLELVVERPRQLGCRCCDRDRVG